MGYPCIHPTGTLIYNKERAYNDYTIFPIPGGALLIDMNGRKVNRWAGLGGFPNKLLPGGQVFGTSGARGGDWLHINCVSELGPRFDGSDAEKKIGWIIGQHHFHMIPKGLPGEGDLLVFDNGGAAGYDAPNAIAPDGTNAVHRDYSRILQFNPITLITEGSDGHLIEVTPDHEIVWEYLSPYFKAPAPGFSSNMVYRAYRAPYEWVPQVEHAPEVSIEPIDNAAFRVPGASSEKLNVTAVGGIDPYQTA